MSADQTHVLVISHDYPPIPSPQAMRVGKLVEGLVANGCSVDVITSMPAVPMDACCQSGTLRVERAVPLSAHQFIRRKRRDRPLGDVNGKLGQAKWAGQAGNGAPLNWKGRLAGLVDRLVWGAGFPGASRAWLPAATPMLRDRLKNRRPDCIVLCHEPPAALELLAQLSDTGIPVVAELGDPVCTPYTPGKWRKSALRLESEVCAAASAITVTCEATRELLLARHAIDPGNIVVITQGFDAAAERAGDPNPASPLRLVYTGRFYPFRKPDALIDAMRMVPDAELVIVAASDSLDLAQAPPMNVRITGELPQQDAIRMQETADILVNIANEGLPQVPGKFYEYLGRAVPILHLANDDDADEQATLLACLHRGWVVTNDPEAIATFLRETVAKHRSANLHEKLDLGGKNVEVYSWASIGRKFADIIHKAAAARQATPAPTEAMENS